MIVAYHPPIFQSMKRLTQADVKQRIVIRCIENQCAIYSPHSALVLASPLSLPLCLPVLANHSGGGPLQDSVAGGINDWLAEGAASLAPSHTHTPHTHAWWQRAKCANLGSVADHWQAWARATARCCSRSLSPRIATTPTRWWSTCPRTASTPCDQRSPTSESGYARLLHTNAPLLCVRFAIHVPGPYLLVLVCERRSERTSSVLSTIQAWAAGSPLTLRIQVPRLVFFFFFFFFFKDHKKRPLTKK
jgi:putative NIF3 family GTP cyclohydrolase 1 type 2